MRIACEISDPPRSNSKTRNKPPSPPKRKPIRASSRSKWAPPTATQYTPPQRSTTPTTTRSRSKTPSSQQPTASSARRASASSKVSVERRRPSRRGSSSTCGHCEHNNNNQADLRNGSTPTPPAAAATGSYGNTTPTPIGSYANNPRRTTTPTRRTLVQSTTTRPGSTPPRSPSSSPSPTTTQQHNDSFQHYSSDCGPTSSSSATTTNSTHYQHHHAIHPHSVLYHPPARTRSPAAMLSIANELWGNKPNYSDGLRVTPTAAQLPCAQLRVPTTGVEVDGEYIEVFEEDDECVEIDVASSAGTIDAISSCSLPGAPNTSLQGQHEPPSAAPTRAYPNKPCGAQSQARRQTPTPCTGEPFHTNGAKTQPPTTTHAQYLDVSSTTERTASPSAMSNTSSTSSAERKYSDMRYRRKVAKRQQHGDSSETGSTCSQQSRASDGQTQSSAGPLPPCGMPNSLLLLRHHTQQTTGGANGPSAAGSKISSTTSSHMEGVSVTYNVRRVSRDDSSTTRGSAAENGVSVYNNQYPLPQPAQPNRHSSQVLVHSNCAALQGIVENYMQCDSPPPTHNGIGGVLLQRAVPHMMEEEEEEEEEEELINNPSLPPRRTSTPPRNDPSPAMYPFSPAELQASSAYRRNSTEEEYCSNDSAKSAPRPHQQPPQPTPSAHNDMFINKYINCGQHTIAEEEDCITVDVIDDESNPDQDDVSMAPTWRGSPAVLHGPSGDSRGGSPTTTATTQHDIDITCLMNHNTTATTTVVRGGGDKEHAHEDAFAPPLVNKSTPAFWSAFAPPPSSLGSKTPASEASFMTSAVKMATPQPQPQPQHGIERPKSQTPSIIYEVSSKLNQMASTPTSADDDIEKMLQSQAAIAEIEQAQRDLQAAKEELINNTIYYQQQFTERFFGASACGGSEAPSCATGLSKGQSTPTAVAT